jgi:hypothetical protein
MRDRWDEEDERDPLRERDVEPELTLTETIDAAVRKVSTSFIIAAIVIALGIFGSSRGGGDEAPTYQITTSADGATVYRVNTDSGSIVACRDNHCWLMQRGNHDLDDEPPEQNKAAAVPAPAASQPTPQQAVPAQPAPAQLPAPQNQQAPAPAAR